MTFIEPYNPDWESQFDNVRQTLETELGEFIPRIRIEHVGSTSVKGMVAKPILDIDIIIDKKNLLQAITTRLEKTGYQAKGEQGIPGRFAFRQSSNTVPLTREQRSWQSHHLYVCYADSLALKNHLLFRDTLRTNNDLIKKYSELKESLTDDYNTTREDYTARKTDFIISVLATAGLNHDELTDIANANA